MGRMASPGAGSLRRFEEGVYRVLASAASHDGQDFMRS
jgi:hypothetical protein